MAEVIACERCSAIFSKINRNICSKCIELEKGQLQQVTDFVKKNPGKSMEELIALTGVPKNVVHFFINTGKLSKEGLGGASLNYPCQMCGAIINKALLCDPCDSQNKEKINALKQTIELDRKNKFGGHKKDNVITQKPH